MSRTPVSILHRGAMERSGSWTLVRRSLDLSSFGMNVVDLAPGESIPAHDETARDQEEVFVALSGSPTLIVDGTDHPFPAGSFARLDPQPNRQVRNDGDETATVLIASAPRTSGFEAMEWA